MRWRGSSCIGILKDSVIAYEAALKSESPPVVGHVECKMRRAKSSRELQSMRLDVHEGEK